ncbi:polyol permease family [Paenibacillus uliginis N3/975]|uniref:Polyol permease family n=1 Tax=Paenibacillus uliginis N3/975 TaxID=1313296 RepID=A0A1X7HI57_9BACL|nr:MFS transporter [Paenibacillus uliginis]SMF86794.1 polyol permease family [Paenibacillus uliginis N3/975]
MKGTNFLDRIGIPSSLAWGYLGILLFMTGDGLEAGWLSPYLVEHGLTVQQSGMLFTVYGVTIALSSFLSGVLVDAVGPKKAMLTGLILYILGSAGFVGLGVSNLSFVVMLLTYAFKGLGYPLFAYSFLVWIAYQTPQHKLGSAVGWFWFVFTGGMNVIGAYYSRWALEHLGAINTLWTALVWALMGALFALIINRGERLNLPASSKTSNKLKDIASGLAIVKKEPKVALAGIVRIINTAAQFGFPIYMPLYMESQGVSTASWLHLWAMIFIGNIVFNLIFGIVGDKIGWKNTVMWFGGVGSAVFTLLLFYSPQIAEGNIVVLQVIGVLWGACLSGYVPLSALVPSLVETQKGAAMSILNLGAGLSAFVGPVLVTLFIGILGYTGITWMFACLFLASSFIMIFITLPDKKDQKATSEGSHEIVNA